MKKLEEHARQLIPYRLRSVGTLTLALDYKMKLAKKSVPMKVFFGDELVIDGNPNILINAALEAGLIHSRALLDFMGIRINPKNPQKLKRRKRSQHPDDVVIENFYIDGMPLSRVSVRDIVTTYADLTSDVEGKLAGLISTTNKRLVHSTSIGIDDPVQLQTLKTASEIVPLIVIDFFYKRLGVKPPTYRIEAPTRLPIN